MVISKLNAADIDKSKEVVRARFGYMLAFGLQDFNSGHLSLTNSSEVEVVIDHAKEGEGR
ncbi:hypothetical protein Gohar_002372 [Gossypium harknessii]|uniref:Uncharacterized protein n=1 Tax=Gossypium harknessii TaxID=34285 RepID=A0A7J9HKK3_9ROSI|nr:hypothetical protein [Gossypium harknessii]